MIKIFNVFQKIVNLVILNFCILIHSIVTILVIVDIAIILSFYSHSKIFGLDTVTIHPKYIYAMIGLFFGGTIIITLMTYVIILMVKKLKEDR